MGRVGLGRRLWLVVGALVVVPVVAGGCAFALLVARADDARRVTELGVTAHAVAARLAATCAELGPASRALAAEAALGDVRRALDNAVRGSALTYASVTFDDGTRQRSGRLPQGVTAAELSPCAQVLTVPVIT